MELINIIILLIILLFYFNRFNMIVKLLVDCLKKLIIININFIFIIKVILLYF